MPRTTLSLMASASLLFAISACQPPSDMSKAATTSNTAKTVSTTKPIEQPNTQPLIEAKTPKALTTALVSLSEQKLTDELICTKLNDAMQAVDNKSEIEDIWAIQRQLKACLPAADNVKALQWLTEYQALYKRFLVLEKDSNEENFYTLMSTIEQGKKPTLALLKNASPRLRYLTALVQSKADVSVLYLGEGDYVFHHDLTAMADLFSPYLHKDQSEFVQQLAQENQGIFWNDAGVAISFADLLARAVFWEDYIQRYPEGYAIAEARDLFTLYRYVLFFGSENTQWTDDEFRKFYNPKDEQLLRQTAASSSNILAQDARKFINFMASERQKKYPLPSDADNKKEGRALTRYQLQQALSLPSPWIKHSSNCSDGIICVARDLT